MNYRHIFCKCGGYVGMYDNRKGFVCNRCNKEYQLYELDYDRILINEKTGWQFPMKRKQ